MAFTVEYVELEGGNAPFLEFVNGLDISERARVLETIDYFLRLKNQNLPIKANLSKHLEDGIFELRTSLPSRIARSLYFYEKRARIIITHGFIKKSEKTPRKEIVRAMKLRDLHNIKVKQ